MLPSSLTGETALMLTQDFGELLSDRWRHTTHTCTGNSHHSHHLFSNQVACRLAWWHIWWRMHQRPGPLWPSYSPVQWLQWLLQEGPQGNGGVCHHLLLQLNWFQVPLLQPQRQLLWCHWQMCQSVLNHCSTCTEKETTQFFTVT